MASEPWKFQTLSLARSLLPLVVGRGRDDLITTCLSKRSELMAYINTMRGINEKKSCEMSWEYMKFGDSLLKNGSVQCLQLYTNSISYAPNNSHLPVAYIKRSLVLLYLDHHEEASRDIEMALSNGLSRKYSFRKVIQLLHMGNYGKARTILYETIKKMKLLPAGMCDMEELESFMCKRKAELKQNLPTVKNGENPYFPSSSNCLKLSYDNKKGRHVLANCDIKAGDVLFVEKAFAFTVTSTYCNWCCKDSVAPIPCLSCVVICFCSQKCRNNAWESFHKFECGFSTLLSETGSGYLALRIIFKAASHFEELKAIIKSLSSKKTFDRNSITFSKTMYENVYYLQSHFERMNNFEALSYSVTATLLALFLVHHTKYAAPLAPVDENVKLLGGLILHHMTQISSNGHKITFGQITNFLEFKTEEIGGGIYPSASMMNHSCEPSVISSFQNDVLIVRACKDIPKGEEVFNCYVPNCKVMERSKRQNLLSAIHFFDCSCSACSQEHDIHDFLNSRQCQTCKAPLMIDLKLDIEIAVHETLLRCVNCNRLKVCEKTEESIMKSDIRNLNNIGIALKSAADFEGAFHYFVVAWKMGRSFFYKFHSQIIISAIMASRCLYFMGDYEQCIAFLKCTVLAIEKQYGHVSVEFAIEQKNLSDCILFHCIGITRRKSVVDINKMSDKPSSPLAITMLKAPVSPGESKLWIDEVDLVIRMGDCDSSDKGSNAGDNLH